MKSITAADASSIRIFTFKRGILSKIAHDLQIRVDGFEIRPAEPATDGTAVEADFLPDHFRVEGTVKNDRLDEGGLSDADKREIKATMRDKVLASQPIRFRGTARESGAGYSVDGTLSMAGRDASVAFTLARREHRLVGAVELQPSRWGIEPYKAMMGAIKLEDRVRVDFDLPDPQQG